MNILARKIGIWYMDQKWASELFEQIIENMPTYAMIKISKNYINSKIDLIDGSSITFLPCKEGQRGHSFSESYVQDGVDVEVLRYIIMPCTKVGTQYCGIIGGYKDLDHPFSARIYKGRKVYDN